MAEDNYRARFRSGAWGRFDLAPNDTTARQPATPPKASQFPLAATAVGASLWILSLAPTFGAPTATINVAALVCVVLLFAAIVLRRSEQRSVGRFLLLVALLTAVFLGTVFSPFVDEGEQLLTFARAAAVIFTLALAVRRIPTGDIALLFGWVISLGVFQSVLAVAQKISGWPPAWGYLGDTSLARVGANPIWVEPIGRAVGTMAHPIPLATTVGVALILAVGTSASRPRMVNALLLVALLMGLAASGTRSAIIGVMAAAFVGLFRTRVVRAQPLLGVAIIAGTIAVALLTQPDAIAETLQLDGGSVSLIHRLDSWSILPVLLAIGGPTAVVGLGWGAVDYLTMYGLLQSSTLTAIDNSVVSTVALGGITALALLALLVASSLWKVPPAARACLVFLIVMMVSFDLLLWLAPFAMLAVMTQLPGASQPRSTRMRSA